MVLHKSLDKSEYYNNITVLTHYLNKWYYYNGIYYDTELQENIDVFLSENIQFVRINENQIVNLNHVEDYSFRGSEGYFIISQVQYKVESSYIAKVRAAKKAFQSSSNTALLPSSMRGAWLRKLRKKQPDKSINVFIDATKIKYMLRKGSRTLVYYENEKNRQFYETLKYFEQHLDPTVPLFRVDRNCIINLKYMNSYKVCPHAKTGELSIDDHSFKISRRQLVTFRKKINDSPLVFAVQKLVE